MSKQLIKNLSIQVHLNGLSFYIFNTVSNTIDYLNTLAFENKQTPSALLNQLKQELSSNTVFSEDFNTVQVIHFNELSTLVPKELYKEAHNADYLKFNAKILKTDFIANDVLAFNSMVNVYVPYVNINNYIFDTFGAFTYKHASSVFIDVVAKQHTNEDEMFCNIEHNTMQLLVFKNVQLNLHNYFEFSTAEDFIYYLLFTIEQLGLDPDTLHLQLSGDIQENDPLYIMAYKYIRHVTFNSVDINCAFETVAHQNFIIKHNF